MPKMERRERSSREATGEQKQAGKLLLTVFFLVFLCACVVVLCGVRLYILTSLAGQTQKEHGFRGVGEAAMRSEVGLSSAGHCSDLSWTSNAINHVLCMSSLYVCCAPLCYTNQRRENGPIFGRCSPPFLRISNLLPSPPHHPPSNPPHTTLLQPHQS